MPNHPDYGYIPFSVGTVRGPYRNDRFHPYKWYFMVRLISGSWAPFAGDNVEVLRDMAHARSRAEVNMTIAHCRAADERNFANRQKTS